MKPQAFIYGACVSLSRLLCVKFTHTAKPFAEHRFLYVSLSLISLSLFSSFKPLYYSDIETHISIRLLFFRIDRLDPYLNVLFHMITS